MHNQKLENRTQRQEFEDRITRLTSWKLQAKPKLQKCEEHCSELRRQLDSRYKHCTELTEQMITLQLERDSLLLGTKPKEQEKLKQADQVQHKSNDVPKLRDITRQLKMQTQQATANGQPQKSKAKRECHVHWWQTNIQIKLASSKGVQKTSVVILTICHFWHHLVIYQ